MCTRQHSWGLLCVVDVRRQCVAGGAGLKERVPSIASTAEQLYERFLTRTSSAAGGTPAASGASAEADAQQPVVPPLRLASLRTPQQQEAGSSVNGGSPPAPLPLAGRASLVRVEDLERALLERARGGRFK
jgi:hypothetical protein